MSKQPLSGVRVLEFAGIGPGPFCGQLLADMGAEVVVVDRPHRPAVALEHAIERRGKRSVILDLKSEAGLGVALKLAGRSDLFIEGLRPGVMERLGLGPAACQAVNPALVYGRMTGWGQEGPYARMAGHDLTYLAITGALAAMGEPGRPPQPPLNLLGDFGGGATFLAMGLLAALVEARTTGQGRVVDAAICDGVAAMMGMIRSWDAAGRWQPQRGANILDGGAPFYRCYETRDGKWVAVAALEPQFHAALLNGLGIDVTDHGPQDDKALWPAQAARLAAAFVSDTREAWAARFAGTDACVAPVLTYDEAAADPHNRARGALVNADGLVHPARAPRFSDADPGPDVAIPRDGADTDGVLAELGYAADAISELRTTGVVGG